MAKYICSLSLPTLSFQTIYESESLAEQVMNHSSLINEGLEGDVR